LSAPVTKFIALLKTHRYTVLAGTMLSAFAVPQWGIASDYAHTKDGTIILAQAPNETPEQRRQRELRQKQAPQAVPKAAPQGGSKSRSSGAAARAEAGAERATAASAERGAPPPAPKQNAQPKTLPRDVQPKIAQPPAAAPPPPPQQAQQPIPGQPKNVPGAKGLPKDVQPRNAQPNAQPGNNVAPDRRPRRMCRQPVSPPCR